jgi:arylsulfatase A-like enzyme
VVNIDIAPSILDLAGLPIPPAMQGRSWAGHLRGDEAGKRSEVYYEYFADYPYQVPPHQAVRTEEWLYVEYERGLAPQLFDRGGDPGQRSDLLAGSGSANLDSVRLELAQRLAALRAEAA